MSDDDKDATGLTKPTSKTWNSELSRISKRVGGLDKEAADRLWEELTPYFQERWNALTQLGRKFNACMNPRLPSDLPEARRAVLNSVVRLRLEEMPWYMRKGDEKKLQDSEEIRTIDSAINYLMMTHLSSLRPVKSFRNTSKDLKIIMGFLNEKFELNLSEQELNSVCMGITDTIRHYLKMDEGKQLER